MKVPPLMTRVHKHGHYTGWFWSTSWRANVHVIWPVTPEQVNAYIKRTFKINSDDNHEFGAKCIEIYRDGVQKANVLAFAQWAGDEFDHGALAHEAFHCADHILSARGQPLTKDSTEAYAYLVQEIVDRTLQIINKKPR